MKIIFKERVNPALLVKLYYKNRDCAAIVLKKLQWLWSYDCIQSEEDKFKDSGSFYVKYGRGRKVIALTSVEDVAIALQEASSSALGMRSTRGISQTLDMPVKTVCKILRNILL
ncbi:hypothetical protein AVEN_149915-1 [Araneus ventricosus]|uniref:Uncharacterized protein n=1 Tax=Araneus ventricosus TaxID=182803 RepID=A0A4Y2DZ79_ARAVE|nr:hypothetical protein AVEN_149915-1 [Araneus ventricosus]